MLSINIIIFLLFFPASFGLLWQAINIHNLSAQLIAIGFVLLCIDQAKMAAIDLQKALLIKKKRQDDRLDTFYQITIITIIMELFGFYIAYFRLGWGAIFVLLSQVYFNSFVNINLSTKEEIKIENKSIQEKYLILCTDTLALILVILWLLNIHSLWMGSMLFSMIVIYVFFKYVIPKIKVYLKSVKLIINNN